MDKIKIEVTSNIAVVAEKPKRITSGTTGLPVEFTFDSEWDELRKVAVFDSCCVRKDMIIKDGATVVPIENLAKHGAWLCIGVYGVNEDGSVAIPTIWANAGMIYPGAVPEGDLGSDIGTAKQQYDEAVLAAERSENAANRSEAAASKAETNANLANDAAFRADASMVSAVSASESAHQSVAEAKNAQRRAEEAAERAEASGGAGAGYSVLYTPQTLTEEQKTQARENIGAIDKATARGELAGFLEEALDPIWQDLDMVVKHTPQELDAEQKAQARENIGAVDEAYVVNAVKGKSYELIDTITFEEAAALDVTQEPDGTPYKFSRVMLLCEAPEGDGTPGEIRTRMPGTTTYSVVANWGGGATSMAYYGEIWDECGYWRSSWAQNTNFSVFQPYMSGHARLDKHAATNQKYRYISGLYSASAFRAGSVLKIYAIRYEGE